MNKRTYKFLLPILVFLFSGCLNFEQISSLKIDGSGETFIHIWTKIDNRQDSLMFEATGLFNEENIINQFSRNFITINSVEVYNNLQDSSIHSKVKFSFTSIDSLNSLNFFSGNHFSFTKDDEGDIIFKQTLQPSVASDTFLDDCSFSYTYYLPGKILEHNASNRSNNKLVWHLSTQNLLNTNTFMARFTPYKLKETPDWVYYSSLFILVVVILYLFKRRRP